MWFKRVDWRATYHHNYGRGASCDINLVWADRMLWQTYKRETIKT